MNYCATLIKTLILLAIRGYQKTISPDHGWGRALFPGAGCHFYPSCSEYAYQSLERYGVLFGIVRAAKRLTRCHPWSSGGLDPVT